MGKEFIGGKVVYGSEKRMGKGLEGRRDSEGDGKEIRKGLRRGNKRMEDRHQRR